MEIIFPQNISFDSLYEANYWDSESINKLPKHIPIYNDKIYLYADFENIVDQSISVYIINNTNESFKYDGYLMSLLQQEFKDANNIWCRSQSYYYGWCGTGYLLEDGIRPGEFTLVKKLFPKIGEKRKIRFNFFKTSITASNSGIGFINLEEVEEAKYDDIALEITGAEFLIKIIKGEIAPFKTEAENEHLITRAIPNLSFYYPDEAIPILESIASDPLNKFQRQAIANLESIEKKKQKK